MFAASECVQTAPRLSTILYDVDTLRLEEFVERLQRERDTVDVSEDAYFCVFGARSF